MLLLDTVITFNYDDDDDNVDNDDDDDEDLDADDDCADGDYVSRFTFILKSLNGMNKNIQTTETNDGWFSYNLKVRLTSEGLRIVRI